LDHLVRKILTLTGAAASERVETPERGEGVYSPKRPDPARAVFVIQARSGVWNVKLDGKFYGDYRRQDHAAQGAAEKADVLRSSGIAVEIVKLSATGQLLTSKAPAPT
jgi:hypothetical protein